MKILIELPTWMGDAVMASAAIENIVNYYDSPEITLIGSSISTEVIKNHPCVKRSHVLTKKYISLIKIVRNLSDFDVFFSFRSSFRSTILKLLVSSKNKYQYKNSQYQNRHQVEKYNDFVNDSLDTNFLAGKLVLYKGKELITNNPKPLVGLNPGASYGSAKRWYPQEFAKVASELSSQYEIIIFGGHNEKDIAADIEKLLVDKGVKNYTNLAGNTTIQELINRISSLDLFITGDSGPMHLAAAFQIPTVAIFGPTNDNETSQWMNEKSMIVKKNLECQPCMKRTCPLKHHNCMKLVEASDVLGAVKRFN